MISVSSVYGQTAPDATEIGPYEISFSEYKLTPNIDPDVLGDRMTELWARVYYPLKLNTMGPRPLIVILHGNHETCTDHSCPIQQTSCAYTDTGRCPPGFEVAQNHAGYNYLASRLSSWGYLVVSINANRGITCGGGVEGDHGLNLARGRLILKHLQRLSEWNHGVAAVPRSFKVDLKYKINFNQIGLLGHSRGGEGIRAAYNLYRDVDSPWPARIVDPVAIRALFEIGGVDGQTHRVLNAEGAAWNQLLPLCDGDVFDLRGIRPFDRMIHSNEEYPSPPKSAWTVWGANHNFYNTTWKRSDSFGCYGHNALFYKCLEEPTDPLWSANEQQMTAVGSVLAFLRAHVGDETKLSFGSNFDPRFSLPGSISKITRIERSYLSSANSSYMFLAEDFSEKTGYNSRGYQNNYSKIYLTHYRIPEHDLNHRSALIEWVTRGRKTFFQSNWAEPDKGLNFMSYSSLDFRVSRRSSDLNLSQSTTFDISLVHADGSLSDPVPFHKVASLVGPGGAGTQGPGLGEIGGLVHSVLQTVRIPLSAFNNAKLDKIRGVRFTFNRTRRGAIYLADILMSRESEIVQGSTPSETMGYDFENLTQIQPVRREPTIYQAEIESIRETENGAYYEMEISSKENFKVGAQLLILKIGRQYFNLSKFPSSGETNRLIFKIPKNEFLYLPNGSSISVQYGEEGPMEIWNAGTLKL